MTQLVLKLSERGEETTIIIPEVELTESFRASITSALSCLVDSASAKIVEDAMLNAPLPAFPCMADEEMLCSCEVQLPHLLAVPPDLGGKPCGKSRGGPKTLSKKVRFSVRLGDRTASYIPMSFCYFLWLRVTVEQVSALASKFWHLEPGAWSDSDYLSLSRYPSFLVSFKWRPFVSYPSHLPKGTKGLFLQLKAHDMHCIWHSVTKSGVLGAETANFWSRHLRKVWLQK